MTSGILEPLDRAAAALRWAPELCPHSGADCAWYHGTWPLLRAVGVASTPAVHAAFFHEAIGTLLARGELRSVLVTGAADEGMLALVAGTLAQHRARPEITVLDRCDTALRLASLWAEAAELPVRTVRRDVLQAAGLGRFDLVCTHAFLGSFSPAVRPELMRTWRALLVPGGTLLTVNRIRSGAPEGKLGFSEAQTEAFVARILAGADAVASLVSRADLEARARTYAANQLAWPVRSTAELEDLLRGAGFSVSLRTERVVREGEPTGPSTPAGGLYAHVVARAAPFSPR